MVSSLKLYKKHILHDVHVEIFVKNSCDIILVSVICWNNYRDVVFVFRKFLWKIFFFQKWEQDGSQNSAYYQYYFGGGGAIYATGGGYKVNIYSSILNNNEATKYGGGICAQDSRVSIYNSTLMQDIAHGEGGAVYSTSRSVHIDSSTSIRSNSIPQIVNGSGAK